MEEALPKPLVDRLQPGHLRRRLAKEQGRNGHRLGGHFIRAALLLSGLKGRGYRNTLQIRVRRNRVALPDLPAPFEGFTLLHLSDLHADLNPPAMERVAEIIGDLEYDLAVLTGDYRARSSGPSEPALEAMETVCRALRTPALGVLGNHDSLEMVPALEAMGVRMLLNESVVLEREGTTLALGGIDDAHRYHTDDVPGVAAQVRGHPVSILLSHTPEVFRLAARAGFDLMLCGHTHGGQICLPGGVPLTLEADLPRRLGAGAWHHRGLQGYTTTGAGSCIVPARFNCPPEVVLHRLERGPAGPV